jgi:hypothetical protein
MRLRIAVVAAALLVIGIPGIAQTQIVPTCFGRDATIVGTSGFDELIGTPESDVIVALGGETTSSPKTATTSCAPGRGRTSFTGASVLTTSGLARLGATTAAPLAATSRTSYRAGMVPTG